MLNQEISKKPLVDILSKLLNTQIVMSKGSYVKLSNKEIVETSIIEQAITEQEKEYNINIGIENKLIVKNKLRNLNVTTTSGKVFYADLESRVDLEVAVQRLLDNNITETKWKLAEPIDGKKEQTVTIEELKEASKLALFKKGSLIGISED